MKQYITDFLKLAQRYPYAATGIAASFAGITGYGLYTLRNKDITLSPNHFNARQPEDATIRVDNVIAEDGCNNLTAIGTKASIFAKDVKAKQGNTLTASGGSATHHTNTAQPRKP